jgi:rhodanese-related sulfurtransferase
MKKSQIIIFLFTCALTASAIIFYKKNPTLTVPTITSTSEKEVVYADPYVTLKMLTGENKNDVLVIDMRSNKDYERNRFKNTVNIFFPYEKDRDKEKAFIKAVEKEAKKHKQIVLLPYSGMSTTGEDAASILLEAGIENIAIMKAGWNELYSLPHMWIPEEVGDFSLTKVLENL